MSDGLGLVRGVEDVGDVGGVWGRVWGDDGTADGKRLLRQGDRRTTGRRPGPGAGGLRGARPCDGRQVAGWESRSCGLSASPTWLISSDIM